MTTSFCFRPYSLPTGVHRTNNDYLFRLSSRHWPVLANQEEVSLEGEGADYYDRKNVMGRAGAHSAAPCLSYLAYKVMLLAEGRERGVIECIVEKSKEIESRRPGFG